MKCAAAASRIRLWNHIAYAFRGAPHDHEGFTVCADCEPFAITEKALAGEPVRG